MENNFFVRYIDDESLIEYKEKKEFKKSKGFFGLWFFYWKKYKVKSIFAIIFILLVSGFSVFNILIARQITSILIGESLIETLNNKELLSEIITGLIPLVGEENEKLLEMINEFLASNDLEMPKELVNNILQKFYFDYLSYDGKNVVAIFFGLSITKMQWVYILLATIGLVIVCMYIAYCFCGIISEESQTDLKNKLIKSLLTKNVDFYNKNSQGKITETIVKDCKNIAEQLKVAPIILLFIVFSTVGSTAMLIYIDKLISILMFSLILCVMLIALSVVLFIAKPVKKSMDAKSKSDSEITEKISAIRLIKSTGTWEKEIEHFNQDNQKQNKYNRKLNYAISIIPGIIIGAIGCLTLSSIVFGVFIYANDTSKLITVFSTFTAGIFVMVTPIFQLNTILQSISSTNKSSQNIASIVNDEDNIIEIENPKFINKKGIESIVFDNVSFAYPLSPESNILNNLSISFEKGKSYAFVGPSGCGKSTITRLLLRFYENYEGSIKINGDMELKDIELKDWLENIGYVDQEPQILSGTIKENLLYVKNDATDKEIIDACKKAKLHDLIMSWEKQYDTFLFERGKQLSGGQKQRLVIARTFLKNPSLIILDEATSALDNLVEKEISIELDKLIVGKTTITIAHRLTTIKNYDKIFVLDSFKKIAQVGTFNELIKKDGLFKELYEVDKGES
ncbi:ABC transporter ATP-binding protein [Spiroplasma cantharicola]|uniref:ABC transporter ATP-binding protein/permease n=1 Tax=Spiroplasma cantharicola TaxID=362837 RepID=A0A0M4JHT2_9MOLU|nr:ABC transporter ATP-binding protein [Spiroplasma cantharicola]ALD66016.1 ABC transporter ATP-binding protein/permease [Spiroplasma cantharicola]